MAQTDEEACREGSSIQHTHRWYRQLKQPRHELLHAHSRRQEVLLIALQPVWEVKACAEELCPSSDSHENAWALTCLYLIKEANKLVNLLESPRIPLCVEHDVVDGAITNVAHLFIANLGENLTQTLQFAAHILMRLILQSIVTSDGLSFLKLNLLTLLLIAL